jgi:hypothetical protein
MTFLWWVAVIGLAFGTLLNVWSVLGGNENVTARSSVGTRFLLLWLTIPFFAALWFFLLRAKP